jgi:hypothetical protein
METSHTGAEEQPQLVQQMAIAQPVQQGVCAQLVQQEVFGQPVHQEVVAQLAQQDSSVQQQQQVVQQQQPLGLSQEQAEQQVVMQQKQQQAALEQKQQEDLQRKLLLQQQQQLVAQQLQQQQHQQQMLQQQLQSGRIQQQLQHQSQQQWQAIPGLTDALTAALRPVAHMDYGWGLEEMVKRVQSYFTKAAKRYEADARVHTRGTAVEAQALIEEFVGSALHGVHSACYEKAWFDAADFSGALMVAIMHTFKGGKVLCRTLGPMLKRYVDDAIFRYKEEERLLRMTWEALVVSGLDESCHKRASKNLLASFDEAHMSAHYGRFISQSAELGVVQAFIRFWMDDFASKSWDMLETGLRGGKEDHLAFLTNVFCYMIDPERCVIHQDIMAQANIPDITEFVQTQAREVLNRLENQPFRKRMRY